jgi:uncharacterized protein YjaG (DUF416 family)
MTESAMQFENENDQEWQIHKEVIRILYLVEDRKLQGDTGVMNEMRSKFGFDKW